MNRSLPDIRALPAKTDKIYLVGFMTAGKTTVARALAQRLSWRLFDLDQEIEARERLAVSEIFAIRGEAYFRELEREVLARIVPVRHAVVATGGGTFVDPLNRAAILADGCSFWLDVSFNEVVARLPPDGRRPLATTRTQMETLFHTRRAAYQQAQVRIDAVRAVDAIVEQILDRIGW
jgi:shikimate kinase